MGVLLIYRQFRALIIKKLYSLLKCRDLLVCEFEKPENTM